MCIGFARKKRLWSFFTDLNLISQIQQNRQCRDRINETLQNFDIILSKCNKNVISLYLVTTGCDSVCATTLWDPGPYHRSPITDQRLPITDHRSPITDYRLPITDYRSPITDQQSPITDHRSPITDQ